MNKNHQTAVRATYFSIATNAALAVIKAIVGVFGNSYALIADAIESATDIFSSLLVLFGLKYASRPADENHPYGHGRAEPLITFIVVGFLIASAMLIAHESIENIGIPHAPPKPWTLFFLGALIIWKELSFRIVMQKAIQSNSSSLKADAWHHRSDAITSVAAFIGITIAVIFGEGYEAADDWAALFASGFILYNAYKIFRPALGEIMDEHLYDDVIANIREVAVKVEGIVTTEKCYVRKAGMQYHIDLHAVVDGTITVKHGHELAHNLQDRLRLEFPEFGNILIHIEPDSY
ncbi:cation transporter [Flavobacterium arcticum]|uniref:Cation transporter n=1 Tax=Flavobacterium arcticum TaxID=1784713 RepID=A0A345HBP6_9FLAO|nr:cation diffusion facilitator family transporter [Flavobacterium arcticum]AXG74006.1 cation transporter [Flavobacterium arcticum]KAF2508984.1 cation transporter [Flavobacterium arcticum]